MSFGTSEYGEFLRFESFPVDVSSLVSTPFLNSLFISVRDKAVGRLKQWIEEELSTEKFSCCEGDSFRRKFRDATKFILPQNQRISIVIQIITLMLNRESKRISSVTKLWGRVRCAVRQKRSFLQFCVREFNFENEFHRIAKQVKGLFTGRNISSFWGMVVVREMKDYNKFRHNAHCECDCVEVLALSSIKIKLFFEYLVERKLVFGSLTSHRHFSYLLYDQSPNRFAY